ncbi:MULTISPECIES: stage II sporulation protein P [Bacillaceae]|uniref:stage II sporulation protein P n=1 Tax=Bacillaceae TaxID=186817 RepID=UPI000C76F0D7|nr:MULTISPECIES: stage II sporulation protein P [Bacillaceae]PLR68197.1 stage II sporulation protein P [Bacillus sp. UMB0893]QNG61156.1 stage II sporulation protein P [Bacillus sp. PAMC26568]
MKRTRNNRGIIVTLNGTSIKKGFVLSFIGFMLIFLLSGALTSLKPEYQISSKSINDLTKGISGQSFIHLLGFENRYFIQDLAEEAKPPSISSIFFKAATSINPQDPRSLLGRELPGFTLFDTEILVAGEGTNYTTMPIESPPPTEVLLEEREASIADLNDLNKQPENSVEPPIASTGDRKIVYIYHTHTTESYLPLLKGVTEPNRAHHSEANVTLVGDRLGKSLQEKGIGSNVDKTNFMKKLNEKGWKYSQSYSMSRQTVETAMTSNKDLEYIIDIHRDSMRYNVTTTDIKGEKYAKIAFIIGGKNPSHDQNIKMATELHKISEKKYPGMSRGVLLKNSEGSNSLYNQDLNNNAMLIEFGGVDNNLEELYRTADAVADIFSDYYWQAEKVDAAQETEKK